MEIPVRHSWRKIRSGKIAILGGVALALSGFILFSVSGAAPRAYSATPTPKILVTDRCTAAVTAYPAASNGDVSPLAPAPTGLALPQSVAVDASGNIYVINSPCAGTVTVYAKGSNGADAAPIAIIGGSNTGLIDPRGIASDSSGKIYVADHGNPLVAPIVPPSVLVYSAGSNGNVAPIATISGSNTGLYYPVDIAVDSSGKIYVAGEYLVADEYVTGVLVYSAGSNGNIAPIATFSSGGGGGIAVDSSGKIYVADAFAESVFVYSAGSNGNAAPIATINGSNTGLEGPVGIAVDSSGKIYVADDGPCDCGGGSVFVYSAGSNGNVAPVATISGSKTGLSFPVGIALDSSGEIYVADDGPFDSGGGSVFLYSAGSNGDAAPIATISASYYTGLKDPVGIAVDSSGKIYVADLGSSEALPQIPPSVFVYPAGSNGNAAPIATISGSNTGLRGPIGMAVDSSGKIYAAGYNSNTGYSVLVYAAGSNGNVAPIATISGSNTGLIGPIGTAVDSSGKIYVANDGIYNDFGVEIVPPSVLVYPAGSNGNVAPTATISGSNTGLNLPVGIAVDSSGNTYVTDGGPDGGGPASVFVYAAGSNGNVASIATISGRNTGLSAPVGIAVDSSGDIYVVDGASVFAYSAGSNGNVAPVATISGPNAELTEPLSIAIQPVAAAPPPTGTPAPTAAATPTPTASPTFTAATATPTPTPAPVGAKLTASATSLTFAKRAEGTISKAQVVTLTNAKTKKQNLTTTVLGVSASGDFAVPAGECVGPLSAGHKCKISVTFTPTGTGTRKGSLKVTSNASDPSLTVSLKGTGKK